MKTIKKIALFTLMTLLVISCGNTKKNEWSNIGKDGSLIQEYYLSMNNKQLDSLMKKDTLPLNLNNWLELKTKLENKDSVIIKYFYVKDMPSQEIYIIEKYNDTLYFIEKRKIIDKK